MQKPALLTLEQLTSYINLGRSRIYAAIRAATFPPPIKLGKSSRWKTSDIDAWIDQQASKSQATA